MSKVVFKENSEKIVAGDLVYLVNIEVYDVVEEENLDIANEQHNRGIVRHATQAEVDQFNAGELELGW